MPNKKGIYNLSNILDKSEKKYESKFECWFCQEKIREIGLCDICYLERYIKPKENKRRNKIILDEIID